MKINACLEDGPNTSFNIERVVSYQGLKRDNKDISEITPNGVTYRIHNQLPSVCPNLIMGDYEPVDWTNWNHD